MAATANPRHLKGIEAAAEHRSVHAGTALRTGIRDTDFFLSASFPQGGFVAGEKATKVLAPGAIEPKRVPSLYCISSEPLLSPFTVCINHESILVNIFEESWIVTRQS